MTKPPKLQKPSKTRPPAEDDAPIDPNEAALLREINEDMRKERLLAFWKRYGGWIVGLALVLALVAIGNQGWRYWQHTRAAQAVVSLEAALDKGNTGDVAGAAAAFEAIVRDNPGSVGAISALNQAVLLKGQGKTADAVRVYVQLAWDPSADPVFRDLARILAVSNGLDVLNPGEIDSLLAGIQNPAVWKPVADELSAHLALKQGDRQKAKGLLEGIFRNPNVSQDMRMRAQAVLLTLTDVSSSGTGAADPTVGGTTPVEGTKGAGG